MYFLKVLESVANLQLQIEILDLQYTDEAYCLSELIEKADEDEWITKNEEIEKVEAQEI